MTEQLLHYIWQFRYFNTGNLQTTDLREIEIINPGNYNTNQGPDFLNAKIKIDKTIWAGSVELHINTSDWRSHKHSSDKNYDNVILHVVWNNDAELQLPFSTLELQHRVSNILLKRYEELMQQQQFIPCQAHINNTPAIALISWKDRLVAERLEQKAGNIEKMLQKNKQHWEETFWWLLARNFGIKINSDAFEAIAQSLPLNILAKHKNQIHQIEALLLGQAGLLEKDFTEDYPRMLQKEFVFLRKKYDLPKIHISLYFLRMRPANFPTIRLAQLAVLIKESLHLFSKIKEAENIEEVEKLLSVTANDYWNYHYVPDEPTSFKKKTLGKQMIQNILINTVIPVLYAYGLFNKNEILKTKALHWLEKTAAEKNNITKGFQLLDIENKNAFDSQALIRLKNEYCDHRLCLQCAIGNKILNQKS
jgi:hypothetical protein